MFYTLGFCFLNLLYRCFKISHARVSKQKKRQENVTHVFQHFSYFINRVLLFVIRNVQMYFEKLCIT